MKRIVSVIMVFCLLLAVHPAAVQASESSIQTVYFEDGSYLTTEIFVVHSRASDQITGTKQHTYYGSEGVVSWSAILRGTFRYTGITATCTYSACDVTVYDSTWYTISKSPAMLGNKASCELIMGRKVLGVTVSRVPVSMVLTCDANGNLS
jgi:hypothetical protein